MSSLIAAKVKTNSVSAKYLLFGKCFKKHLNIFSNFFFYLKVQSFRLIMENKHIINCVQLYFTNGYTNIVLKSVNCLCLVGIRLICDGTPQIVIQGCQIAAPRRPNDISWSAEADNAILKNRAQNVECSFDCVARSFVLLKPNVANSLLFNFCEQKFVQHDLITIAIDCNGL